MADFCVFYWYNRFSNFIYNPYIVSSSNIKVVFCRYYIIINTYWYQFFSI